MGLPRRGYAVRILQRFGGFCFLTSQIDRPTDATVDFSAPRRRGEWIPAGSLINPPIMVPRFTFLPRIKRQGDQRRWDVLRVMAQESIIAITTMTIIVIELLYFFLLLLLLSL